MIDFSDKEKTKAILSEKAELFKSIAHPVRLCILAMLINEKQSNVTDIQCCLDVPQPTVSQHLSKLKSAGIQFYPAFQHLELAQVGKEVKNIIIQILDN